MLSSWRVVDWQKRSRTNKRHLASQNVVELGQLVQSATPQQFPEFRRAVLIRDTIPIFVMGSMHGAKLIEPEETAEAARPLLPKHHREPNIDSYQRRYQCPEGCQN